MIRLVKTSFPVFFVVSLLSVSACFTNTVIQTSPIVENNIAKTDFTKKILGKIKKGAEVKIQINSLSYSKKAYSSAVFPKTNADVKAYWLFLSNNFADPFASGANVLPGGQILKFDKANVPNPVIFHDIPEGGPYYAVVAVFDDVVVNPAANNITEPDITLDSIDKKWRRSTNSVKVVNSSPVYSDSSGTLSIQLLLKFGVPAKLDTSVSILPGAPFSGPETIN